MCSVERYSRGLGVDQHGEARPEEFDPNHRPSTPTWAMSLRIGVGAALEEDSAEAQRARYARENTDPETGEPVAGFGGPFIRRQRVERSLARSGVMETPRPLSERERYARSRAEAVTAGDGGRVRYARHVAAIGRTLAVDLSDKACRTGARYLGQVGAGPHGPQEPIPTAGAGGRRWGR